MHNIVAGLNARRIYKGWSMQFLADMLNKDVSTVKRQLNEKTAANLTLATVDEYIKVLGGWISYETEESRSALDDIDVNGLRMKITEQGIMIDHLNSRLDEKDRQIAEYQERIGTLEKALIEASNAMTRKDGELHRLVAKLEDIVTSMLK